MACQERESSAKPISDTLEGHFRIVWGMMERTDVFAINVNEFRTAEFRPNWCFPWKFDEFLPLFDEFHFLAFWR